MTTAAQASRRVRRVRPFRGRHGARLPADAALLLIGVCFLLPLLWLVFASLDAGAGHETRVPTEASLDNFAAVMTPGLLFQPLWNSMVLSAGTAAVNLVAAVLAAYPLSRFQSRFNRPFLYAVLFGTCLPITAIMVHARHGVLHGHHHAPDGHLDDQEFYGRSARLT
jgi:multiple sugar transport system permease protein